MGSTLSHQVLHLQILAIIPLLAIFGLLILRILRLLINFDLRVMVQMLLVLRACCVLVADIILDLHFQRLKALPIGYVVDRETPIGISKVRLRYRLEAFLAGSIPHLHLYELLIHSQGLYLEIDSDGREGILVENVIGESQKH